MVINKQYLAINYTICVLLRLNKNNIMSVSKYVNWMELWSDKVCLDDSCLDELLSEAKENVKMFKQDHDVELMNSECDIIESGYLIYFGESGEQNESDNQGSSRDYCFHLDFEFVIQDVTYEQG